MKIETDWRTYLRKWRGTTANSPPRLHGDEIFWSWLGTIAGIGTLAYLSEQFFTPFAQHWLLASFGASAVLVYGAPRSPLAQPRNLVGGHVVSAFVGVLCWQLFHPWPALAQALAVSTAIILMYATRTLHPPGGATALTVTLGTAEIQRLGFWFVLMPAAAGALILLLVALVVNNLPRTRRYPEYWF